ncbi:Os08g0484533, partial [Oryza sativa Japonica Group]
MIGIWPPNMSTTDIWRSTRKVSRMLFALNSLKLSAQSPPWRRNARPTAASASRSSSLRASPAKTIGGNASTVRSTSSSSALSGYSGCCSAVRLRQLPSDHLLGGRGAARTARARRRPPRRGARAGHGEEGRGGEGHGARG